MAAVSASVTSSVMFGRERELARLSEALDALSQGRGHQVVISGEAGIGKTRLISESVEQADADVRVLRADCLALGNGVPYLPFAELLRDLQRQMSVHDLARVLGTARADLARFLPEVAVLVQPDAETTEPTGRTERPRSDELERLRLFEAFLRMAERVAVDVPTAYVIEDVQWIDRASLELLAFLAHGLAESGPSMLIVSVRPEELEDHHQVLTLLAQLGRAPRAVHIELGPLDEGSTRRMASAVLKRQPEDELVERVQRLSGGNPLFAEELLVASLRGGSEKPVPPKLRDLLAVRLSQVPDPVMEVLRIAAAAGRSVDDRLLTHVSGLDEGGVRDAVRYALDDHILVRSDRSGDTGYRFRHEIMRELVASQLLPEQARRIHAAYAEELTEVSSERRSLTEIAQHWDAAGEVDRALAAHVEAAQVAAGGLAYREALEHDERALQIWESVEHAEEVAGEPLSTLMADTASAAARGGVLGRAIELTRRRIEQRDVLDGESFEQARSSLRWYLWEAGDLEGALSDAEAVLAEPDDPPGRWRANALGHAAGLLLYLDRTQRARELAREALDVAREAGAVDEQVFATGVLGWCLLLEGDVDAGLDAISRAVEDAHRIEAQALLEGRHPVYSPLAHSQLSVALELVGRLEEAHAAALDGVAVAKRQGVSRTFGSVLQASAARALYQLGRWDEATSAIDEAIDAGALGSGRVSLLALRALVAVGRDRPADAEATLAHAETLADESMPIDVQRWLTVAAAECSIWQGDSATALTRIGLLVGEAESTPVAMPGARPAVLDASVPYLLALGARAAADVALTERAAGVRSGPSAMAVSQLQSAIRRAERRQALARAWAAELAVAKAELDRATEAEVATRIRHWKTAVKRAEGRPYLGAYARWRLAEAQLANRDGRDAAAETIGAALAIAESMGAARLEAELTGLAQRARLSIVSSAEGRLVTPSDRERPFGLTAREAEVLSLVAEGLSNQEIAERLYISPKTASVHVSNIYGKLGVESRVAAATTAHNLGLAGTLGGPRDKED